MSTVYCYVRNAGPKQYIQYSLHLLNLRQSKRNPHKHAALDVCLSLENAWEDTYQIFITFSGKWVQEGRTGDIFIFVHPIVWCMADFFFLIFMLYWSIVDLLYCVSFRWTAKWISYTWICFSSDSFPYWLLQNIEQRSLCYTVGRALLIICGWSFYNLVLFIKLNQRKQEGRLQERCVTGVRELIWARALWVL